MHLYIIVAIFAYTLPCSLALAPHDPWDLSGLKRGAAVGDSFAAGLGAGNEIQKECRRHDGSYANLLVRELGTSTFDFSYVACTGALVQDVRQQVAALPDQQQFITVSAGGNDVGFSHVLDRCIYLYAFWHGEECEVALTKAENTVNGPELKASVNSLISEMQAKLSRGARIYYVGYAKFFDASDTGCDTVHWTTWYNAGSPEYLTRSRRRRLNDLVDATNRMLRDAIEAAGNSIEFIDFDPYIDYVGGRFCSPGVNEADGAGANRETLFFYQEKSQDEPWEYPDQPMPTPSTKVRKRRAAVELSTSPFLEIGKLMLMSLNGGEADVYALDTGNAINDLSAMLSHEQAPSKSGKLPASSGNALASVSRQRANSSRASQTASHYAQKDRSSSIASSRAVASRLVRRYGPSAKRWARPESSQHTNEADAVDPRPSVIVAKASAASRTSQSRAALSASQTFQAIFRNSSLTRNYSIPALGSLVRSPNLSAFGQVKLASTSGTTSNATVREGMVIGNATHVLLADNRAVQKSAIKQLFIGTETARVFHPTQYGHAIIKNVIMHRMAAYSAQLYGILDFPPFAADDMQDGWLNPDHVACQGALTGTWAARDAAVAAIDNFCANPRNMRAKKDTSTSAILNEASLDRVNISVMWREDGNLGQHACRSWLLSATDNCDIPLGSFNTENVKHGGVSPYRSHYANAELSLMPLSVRREWNGGKLTSGQVCEPTTSPFYLDEPTLTRNVAEYCKELAGKSFGQPAEAFKRRYNEGTPDRVDLSIVWPAGQLNFQLFESECLHYMGLLNDKCSILDSWNARTQTNWKHGGTITDRNGISYTIKQVYQRREPPERSRATCSTSYRGVFYSVWMQGQGFANSDYGQANLLPALKRCGATTEWSFNYFSTPNSDGYEWEATARLPISIGKNCVGWAVEMAGGPKDFYC